MNLCQTFEGFPILTLSLPIVTLKSHCFLPKLDKKVMRLEMHGIHALGDQNIMHLSCHVWLHWKVVNTLLNGRMENFLKAD